MVSKEQLKDRLHYDEGDLYWKNRKWEGCKAGYRRESDGYLLLNFTVNGKYVRLLAHRIIFCMFNGYFPDLVDHIDMNPRNNSIENLRDSNKSQNALNTLPRNNNRSGVKGVWESLTGKYQASVWYKGKKVYLGSYDELEQAKLRIEGWKKFHDFR
jgi:hypothetical protein